MSSTAVSWISLLVFHPYIGPHGHEEQSFALCLQYDGTHDNLWTFRKDGAGPWRISHSIDPTGAIDVDRSFKERWSVGYMEPDKTVKVIQWLNDFELMGNDYAMFPQFPRY